ncbi:MAG TPA: hypothetical protein VNN20_08765 [Thermodesulfobacteriota bacterium]|nr:hypothetical protein [Thermodesulfobacteriota bacterium]
MRGVFTICLSEFIDLHKIGKPDVQKIAHALVGQVLMRSRTEDGSITVLHLMGMPLGDWLNSSTTRDEYR